MRHSRSSWPTGRTQTSDQHAGAFDRGPAIVLTDGGQASNTDADPAEPLPTLMTPAQVADTFGRSSATIHRWLARGHLSPIRVGRSVFIAQEEVRALIRQQLVARIEGPDRARRETTP
jgi:excisionase family DNA binding protein